MTQPRLRTLAAASAVITAIAVAVAIGMPHGAIGMPGPYRVYDVSPGTALVSTDRRSITVGTSRIRASNPPAWWSPSRRGPCPLSSGPLTTLRQLDAPQGSRPVFSRSGCASRSGAGH